MEKERNWWNWCRRSVETDDPYHLLDDRSELLDTITGLEILAQGYNHTAKKHRLKAQKLKESGDVSGAKSQLLREAAYKRKCESTWKMYNNLHALNDRLVDSKVYSSIHSAMRDGSDQLKQWMSRLNPDDIQELIDELEENDALAEEVGRILSTPMTIEEPNPPEISSVPIYNDSVRMKPQPIAELV